VVAPRVEGLRDIPPSLSRLALNLSAVTDRQQPAGMVGDLILVEEIGVVQAVAILIVSTNRVAAVLELAPLGARLFAEQLGLALWFEANLQTVLRALAAEGNKMAAGSRTRHYRGLP